MMKLSLQAYGTPDVANAEYLDSQFAIDQVMSTDLTTIKPDDAIRSAVRANPPVVIPPKESIVGLHMRDVSNRMMAAFSTMAIEYATGWIEGLLKQRNGTS